MPRHVLDYGTGQHARDQYGNHCQARTRSCVTHLRRCVGADARMRRCTDDRGARHGGGSAVSVDAVQVHPITPARDSVRSTTAQPQRIGQSRVAPAMFSAPVSVAASVPRPRRTDRVLSFSDHGRIECNVDECECATSQVDSDHGLLGPVSDQGAHY